MRVPSTAVRRLRLGPVKLDWALAAALTVGIEVEVWLGGGARQHRLGLAVAGVAMTVAVGFRRRYPATVGVGSGQ